MGLERAGRSPSQAATCSSAFGSGVGGEKIRSCVTIARNSCRQGRGASHESVLQPARAYERQAAHAIECHSDARTMVAADGASNPAAMAQELESTALIAVAGKSAA